MKEGKYEKSSDYVLLREIGKFVSVFDEDSIIISYLMGYKIVNSKVGFPSNVLVKVINKLEDNNINYLIKYKDNKEDKKDFNKNNNYKKILEKGKKVLELREMKDNITPKLEILEIEKLEKIVKYINEVVNE